MAASVREHGNSDVEVYETTDMSAAKDIKAGKTDYYFGLVIVVVVRRYPFLLEWWGITKCCTVAKNGQKADEKGN